MSLNSIEKLRIWCQKVLPLVYDDSLSYYEVLTKVVNKLNEVINLAQEQNETIEKALSEIDTFETDMTSQFETYKTTLNAALDAFEAEITAQQSGFEGRMTQEFADFLADYEREFGITNLYGDSTTLAISQNQVSKLLDYTTNNNRFNPEVITSGKAIDNTGAVVNNANTAVTGYIEVQPGENIVAQAKNNTTNERYQGAGTGTDVPLVFDSIAGYDEDLTFVSGSYKSLVFNYQVPVGVKYIKLAMGQTILDGTNTDMSELAIVNSDGTIYPYQPYSEQNATVKMNALPVDDTTVGNHLWTANKINEFQAAVQGEFNQLETDLTGTVQGAIGDMNTAFTQKSGELDTKFDTMEGNIQDQQDAFETEIEGALASQKTELEGEIAEVASDVQTLSGSVATQGQAISNLTGITTSLDGRVDTLETDMAAAKGDISDLEASNAQHNTDIAELQGSMAAAESNIDSLETASEQHTTAISNLQAKDAEIVGDINGLTTRVGSAEGDIDLLEGRADALETDVDNLETDVAELEEKKADRVGYEKDLNVGGADMLIGNGTISDDKAYNFRRTADGNQNVGNREIDEIIGGTLVINQLIDHDNAVLRSEASYDSNTHRFTIDVAENAAANNYVRLPELPLVVGHKYFLRFKVVAISEGASFRCYFPNSASPTTVTGAVSDKLFKYQEDFYNYLYVGKTSAITQKQSITFEVMLIDLTQMFGSSTIADYVNNLETTTAGAGVAWMYKYFPILNGGFIPHNTGTMQSIVLSKHVMTEFNQWDEEWFNGYWDTTSGAKVADSRNVACNDFIRVAPNTKYYFQTDIIGWVNAYNISRQFIGEIGIEAFNGEFTTPSNCYFITFYMPRAYGTVYKNDICINFSGERNGEYEPYNGHEYTLDSSKELRGVAKIDSNGNLYFNGDRYKDAVTRRFALVDLGDMNWSKHSSNYFYTDVISNAKGADINLIAIAICDSYLPVTFLNIGNKQVTAGFAIANTTNRIYVYDASKESLSPSEFKESMSGKMIAYEISEPSTETATPVPNPQICSPYGTEEYIDPRVEAGTIPFAIPTGHETVYNTSLNYKLNQIPALPTAAGVYKLQVTLSSGVPSYKWVGEE